MALVSLIRNRESIDGSMAERERADLAQKTLELLWEKSLQDLEA